MMYAVNIHTGKVAQCGTLEDDLWVWLDEVAGLDRKAWSVWSRTNILERFGHIAWANQVGRSDEALSGDNYVRR